MSVFVYASIIQSETGRVSDMMYISAVFHNRLNSKKEDDHILGSSATINYLIKTRGGRATIKHTDEQLNIDSPYNTYTHEGLPPGPICMPGSNAIAAALYPEPNCNYMYFCATGDGGTAYATTYAEHQKNVKKYSANWDAADSAVEVDDNGVRVNEDGTIDDTSETTKVTDP